MQTFAARLIKFYEQLEPPPLPKGISILRPQTDKNVMDIVKTFFKTFYSDKRPRKLILGINPGRFGAGITGINFTAPRQLTENCQITHPFGTSSELSAEFIYEMIEQYGGSTKFYADYFIGAVSPLGFMKDGKNINYYDEKKLQSDLTPFITTTILQQVQMGIQTDLIYCIGGEKNFNFLSGLNSKHHFFEKIVPLPHPRFIMQYRRKKKQEYIDLYLDCLHRQRPTVSGIIK